MTVPSVCECMQCGALDEQIGMAMHCNMSCKALQVVGLEKRFMTASPFNKIKKSGFKREPCTKILIITGTMLYKEITKLQTFGIGILLTSTYEHHKCQRPKPEHTSQSDLGEQAH